MNIYVEIVETQKNLVVKRMGPCASQHEAERVEGGVNINLNHDVFHTRIVEGFALGDKVTYTASDVVRSAQIEAYPAMVISSAAVSPKGLKHRIEYVKAGKTVRSWVLAKRLTGRKA